MGDPSDVPDRSDLVAALTPDARPAAVLRWLQQGHQRFLAGQSLHPHSTRERMQSVVEGQHPLAAGAGDPGDVAAAAAAGDGVGGLASSQAIPERSLSAMDVRSETLISRLRQHAPVWSERFGVQSLRVFGSWARGTATSS